jgi:hypothetical protein
MQPVRLLSGKPPENQRDVRRRFFAGAPFPVLASGQTTVVPFPLLSEEREGKAQGLRHIHSPSRLCDSTLEKSEVERLRQRAA